MATGKKNFLSIALKNADLLCSVFGPDKRSVVPGHEIVEMGLVRLYRITADKKYLNLAKFLIDCRGKKIDNNRQYWQDHAPITQQKESVNKTGSSFRANFVRFSFLIVGTAMGGLLGIPLLNYFSAPGILSTEAMIFVKERSFSIEIMFLAILFGLQLTILPRFWCRLFCPTGSLLSAIRSPLTLRVEFVGKISSAPCCKENSCSEVCPMGLMPYMESRDLLCVNCGRCVDACNFNRLRFGGLGSVSQSLFPKTTLREENLETR